MKGSNTRIIKSSCSLTGMGWVRGSNVTPIGERERKGEFKYEEE